MQVCLLVMQLNRPSLHKSLLFSYMLLSDVYLWLILLSFPYIFFFFFLVYVLGAALKQVSLPFLRIKENSQYGASVASSVMAFRSGGFVCSYRASGVCFPGIILLHLFIHYKSQAESYENKARCSVPHSTL